MGFPGGSVVRNPTAKQEMQETWVPSLGQEDPLEKEMAAHFNYSCLGNPTDTARQSTVHGVTHIRTQLGNSTTNETQ